MMEHNQKLCKDCTHCITPLIYKLFGGVRFSKCGHPNAVESDDSGSPYWLVDGHSVPKREYAYCVIMRKYSCGAEAKFWEPK